MLYWMRMAKKKYSPWLIIGAVGVVFGDIGTSPLYALQAIFGASKFALSVSDITGIISLIIWSVTIVVTVKYIGLMMSANNNGEGGIMALLALIRRTTISNKQKAVFALLAMVVPDLSGIGIELSGPRRTDRNASRCYQ
jgi:KUP system potassium uptake protein